MKDVDYMRVLTDIDDSFVFEAATASYTAKFSHKRKIVLLVAAAAMALMLVACSVLVARSEVFTDKTPSDEVDNRVEAITEPKSNDDFNYAYLSRYTELLAEYGMCEEDIIVKTYQEYIRYGYYFDEVILVTKDTAVGRIITDAESFTFDVEFIGFFYNERTDEFKTISEKITAPGGKIEIIMNSEYGWECFGGILRRTHPETETKGYFGIWIHKYGIKPSVRAMKFIDKYYDEMNESIPDFIYLLNEIEDIATIKSDWLNDRDSEVFALMETSDPIERIEQIASAFDMAGITGGKTFYDSQAVSEHEFVEVGYAYDNNRLLAFINNTVKSAIVEDWHLSLLFYNAEKDQYRVIKKDYSDFSNFVLPIETKEGWDFIGLYMYRSKPESDEYEFVDYSDFTPVENDEADSQKMQERIKREITQDKQTTTQTRDFRLERRK